MIEESIRHLLKAKLYILESITERLPDITKERVNSLQQKLMTIVRDTADEYLAKKKPENGGNQVKKVYVD